MGYGIIEQRVRAHCEDTEALPDGAVREAEGRRFDTVGTPKHKTLSKLKKAARRQPFHLFN